jgi:regulator of protease activity HflC (stomatin/prohibitin superfamily)
MFNKKAQEGSIIATGFIILLIIGAILLFMAFETVPAGSVGVKDTFGQVEDNELEPGFYVLNPFTNVVDMTTRVQKATYETVVGISKDSQEVTTEVTVNYRLTPNLASDMYKNVGSKGYVEVIGQPIIIGVIKSELAKYQATEFASNWEKMKAQVSSEITIRLLESGIIVTEVSITDFDFTEQFNRAIDNKVTAEQQALQAVNDKQKKITQAEAEAESVRLSSDAYAYGVKVKADSEAYALSVIREELSKSKELVQYKAVEQWNGQLPTFVTSSDGSMLFNLPVNAVN